MAAAERARRDADQRDLAAARRAFIRAEHPDVGGDPERFAQGLAAFERGNSAAGLHLDRRLTVRRSRRPDRVVARAVRGWHRKLTGRPERHLL